MTGGAGNGWTRAETLAVVAMIVGAVVPCLIAYVVHEAFRNWVRGVAARLGVLGRPYRWLRVVIRRRVQGARAWAWDRARRLAEKMDPGGVEDGREPSGDERVPDEVWRRIGGVRDPGRLTVLLCALVECRGKGRRSGCEVSAWALPSDRGMPGETSMLVDGCRVWKMREVFSDYVLVAGPAAQVWLAEDIWEADREGALAGLVREALERASE
jgi:hypothetical protein